MNRPDITIAITASGHVYVAQGPPATRALPDDVTVVDGGLYYSQVRHRVVARLVSGELAILCPSAVPTGAATMFVSCECATGEPSYQGRI